MIANSLYNHYRWRLVVHGGVDGFSRFIVYLRCNNNNESTSVLELFRSAVHNYGLPDSVRSDCGGENVKVNTLHFVALSSEHYPQSMSQ